MCCRAWRFIGAARFLDPICRTGNNRCGSLGPLGDSNHECPLPQPPRRSNTDPRGRRPARGRNRCRGSCRQGLRSSARLTVRVCPVLRFGVLPTKPQRKGTDHDQEEVYQPAAPTDARRHADAQAQAEHPARVFARRGTADAFLRPRSGHGDGGKSCASISCIWSRPAPPLRG